MRKWIVLSFVAATLATPAGYSTASSPSPCSRDASTRAITASARFKLLELTRAQARAEHVTRDRDQLRQSLWAQRAPQGERARVRDLASRLARLRTLEQKTEDARAMVAKLERELGAIRDRGRRAGVPPGCLR